MPILRKGTDNVPCHYIFVPTVACHCDLCRKFNSRNGRVDLSIIGDEAHDIIFFIKRMTKLDFTLNFAGWMTS